MPINVPTQEEFEAQDTQVRAVLTELANQVRDLDVRVTALEEDDVVIPPTPDPDPEPEPEPPSDAIQFTDMPTSWQNGKTYEPADPNRVYDRADLRGTDGVTLRRTRIKGTPSGSRYSGAVILGKNSTIDDCVFDQCGRLCIEMPRGADNPTIKNSTFTNNDYNAIWSHAWHRNYGGQIFDNYFKNNNRKKEALNWDAADIKLLHHLNVDTYRNTFEGGYGDAVWYDSDAQGKIYENKISGGYAHGIFVEMANVNLGETQVYDNTMDDIHGDTRGWIWGAAILLSGSSGVKVWGNTVTNARYAYSVLGIDRPDHTTDRVHAEHGEQHDPKSGYNEVNTNGLPLHVGHSDNSAYWHPWDSNTFVASEIIKR